VRSVGGLEHPDDDDPRPVELALSRDEGRERINLLTEKLTEMRLGISSSGRLPALDRSIIGDAEEEPPADRVRERSDRLAQPGASGRLLLPLDEEMLAVRDQAAHRRIIHVAEGEASQPVERHAPSLRVALSASGGRLRAVSDNLKKVRASLQNPDDLGYVLPEGVSAWAGLTDDEMLRLYRKVAAANLWNFDTRFGHEFSGWLIAALTKSAAAAATASRRLELLTWALVGLTVVIAAFTVALFLHG
jgi:hypothetical protein